MKTPNNNILPESRVISFCFNNEEIASLPGFLFRKFIKAEGPEAKNGVEMWDATDSTGRLSVVDSCHLQGCGVEL